MSYLKGKQLFNAPMYKNKIHRISHRLNTVNSSVSPSFKYSANMNNKDCFRMVFLYGSCGTLLSYLSMNYDGKVLVFKFHVPAPERFIFSSFCWAMAGGASWMLFWSRPDVLARVASSKLFYGGMHGIQTSILALAMSFNTIGFWSFYFDVKQWQEDYGEWQNQLMADKAMMTDSNSNNTFIEEEGNEENAENKKKKYTSKPILTYNHLAKNMYEPCRQFFLGNSPIWMFGGSMTGMLAARMVTQTMMLHPVAASSALLAACSIEQHNEECLELLE